MHFSWDSWCVISAFPLNWIKFHLVLWWGQTSTKDEAKTQFDLPWICICLGGWEGWPASSLPAWLCLTMFLNICHWTNLISASLLRSWLILLKVNLIQAKKHTQFFKHCFKMVTVLDKCISEQNFKEKMRGKNPYIIIFHLNVTNKI